MLVVCDLEVIKNLFLYCDLNLIPFGEGKDRVHHNGDKHSFMISPFENQLPEFIKYLESGLVRGMIGYNILRYDYPLIHHIMENKRRLLEMTAEQFCEEMYLMSQTTISTEFPEVRENKRKFVVVDPFRIWHFDNKAKATSLKWVQYSMDWHNIEDMPFSHTYEVQSMEETEMIRNYCFNDVESTAEFYRITRGETSIKLYKGVNRIGLRKDIQAEMGLDAWNWNDVKIGNEVILFNYMNTTRLNYSQVRSLRNVTVPVFYFKDCFPDYMEFKTPEMKTLVERIGNTIVDFNNKQEFHFNFYGVNYTFAKGGLHSEDTPRLIECPKGFIFRDADVGLNWPN